MRSPAASPLSTRMSRLTEHFTEARYSRHEITGEQAQTVKGIWERLRKLIHRRSSPNRQT